MPTTIYEVLWIFIIYAFFGWCTEVSYAALDRGIFVNRGFLNGPYCPIYGIGVLTVVVVLTPLKENLLILYIGSFFLTTILEFLTGFILEKVFHNKRRINVIVYPSDILMRCCLARIISRVISSSPYPPVYSSSSSISISEKFCII